MCNNARRSTFVGFPQFVPRTRPEIGNKSLFIVYTGTYTGTYTIFTYTYIPSIFMCRYMYITKKIILLIGIILYVLVRIFISIHNPSASVLVGM